MFEDVSTKIVFVNSRRLKQQVLFLKSELNNVKQEIFRNKVADRCNAYIDKDADHRFKHGEKSVKRDIVKKSTGGQQGNQKKMLDELIAQI